MISNVPMIGCENADGTLNIHPESKTCEVCKHLVQSVMNDFTVCMDNSPGGWSVGEMAGRGQTSFGVDVERHEDMSTIGKLRLTAQDDGDMIVSIIDAEGIMVDVEFCASGGRSPETLQALRELSHAMRRDNENPNPRT